jgi:hypothetical protein
MTNPFHYNRPVEPAYFVGRWPLVHKIADDLARADGDSYAIVGGRRFGKSSLLLALQQQLVERLDVAQTGEIHVLPLMLDFKALRLDAHQHLFAQVIEELRWTMRPTRSLRRRGPHLPLELDDALLDQLYPPGQPPASLNTFRRAIGDVIDRAFDVYGELRLVLLIDEIEEALDREWTETLFNQLRALIYGGALVESLRLVIAGDDRVLKMRAQGSPLLNMLVPEYLAVLDEADTRHIIARAQDVPAAVADAVVGQSGGHPYLTQSLMHQLWEKGLAQASPSSVTTVAHQLTVTRRGILENWYEAIGPAGQATLAVLTAAAAEAWLSEAEIKAQVTNRSVPVTEGLTSLCYHGFAVHDGDWRRYRYSGELFRDWFREEYERGDAQAGVDRGRLHERLVAGFDLVELDGLIFELGLAPDDIAGDTISSKSQELVLYYERRNRLRDLLAAVDRLRPE